ncbi:MAG: hypothetical protein CSA18_04535 [Deltaproteobacteria bacterium]|nr:MAG: hypothetical protein CSB21_01530 [Deltaproteobacteria bacterium]PIE74548.1 MAG: hypothetical protein CSA18_04535 [Deltaproteobacteria bacterium]
MLFYFAIFLTVLSNVFYHIFQKSIPDNTHPIISLITTYMTAILFSVALFPFYPHKTEYLNSIKNLNWSSFALGVAIVGLEMGFLLAYRAGWNINTAAVFSNVAVAIILIPIGLLFFKENLSIINLCGICFCIIGLFLIKQ